MKVIAVVVVFFSAASIAGAATLTIQSDKLIVNYDDAAKTFSATEKATGKPFLVGGKLEREAGNAWTAAADDRVFGKGERIVVAIDGGENSLELYAGLPFVLVRGTRHNDAATAFDQSRSELATFALDLGKPAAELCTVGTGGLLAPDKNPGSYLFLTCADPATRRGVVAGWITEDRGSGVVFSKVEDGKVEFTAQIDYGRLRIPAGRTATLETLAIGCFGDARIGEELYAAAIRKQYDIKLRPPQATYCSWYAEKHGKAGDEKSTVELARFIAKELKPFGLGVVQIDDDWQAGGKYNGPRRGFDRVRPNGPYAHGIAPVAAEVDKLGLTFGLWWLPFARNFQDPEYKDRQDWFVKRDDGEPYDTKWGGTCLDLTNPEVQAQLARIAKLYRSRGVKYFKMDGLWTGAACEQVYVNDGYKNDSFGNNQPLHDPLVSNIEAYRGGLKLLRQSAGDDVFFSGCCVSQNMRELTTIGLVDAMRVGPDANGDIRRGPLRGSRLYFLNGRVWWNDPDPATVRAAGSGISGNAVTLDEARLTTSWVAISGQYFLVSDWLPDLPADRLDVLKRTMAHHDAIARPVDYFERDIPNTWVVTDARQSVRRDVIGLFNFERSEISVAHTCEQLGLEPGKTYHAFDFWANAPLPDFTGSFKAQVAPRSCRVIAMRAAEGHPLVISTSRHVTQGIIDLTNEKWNGNTLSGTSQVIANDPYELRICVPAGWKLAKASAPASETRGLVRTTLQSATTQMVDWEVSFTAPPKAVSSSAPRIPKAIAPQH